VIQELKPGRAGLHMEFTPRGEQVWVSSRDDNRVTVYDTATFAALAQLPADHPSGIFLTSRAFATGF
jgi:protein NirF